MPVRRLMDAATKAKATPKHMANTMVSSVATFSTTSPVNQVWMVGMFCAANTDIATHSTVSTSSEVRPLEPSFSFRLRASGGRAGTMCGLKKASRKMNSM